MVPSLRRDEHIGMWMECEINTQYLQTLENVTFRHGPLPQGPFRKVSYSHFHFLHHQAHLNLKSLTKSLAILMKDRLPIVGDFTRSTWPWISSVCSSDSSPLCVKTSENTRPMFQSLTFGTEISLRSLYLNYLNLHFRRIGTRIFAGCPQWECCRRMIQIVPTQLSWIRIADLLGVTCGSTRTLVVKIT